MEVRSVMGCTHAAAGAFAGALVGKFTGAPVAGPAIGALAALLPDVDHPGSWAGCRLRPLAVLLEKSAGHRGLTHTVWFSLLVAVLATVLASLLGAYAPVLPPAAAGFAALLGALSHLALDACTRSGVRPLEPLNDYHVSGPLTTGDPLTEWPACLLFAAAALRLAGVV